jgi:tripartite-type tricarboxylate transporter receptor subunit TctC
MSRVLADQIGRVQGVSVVVENRPGRTVGTEAVARATADGGTLLVVSPAFIIFPNLEKVSFDPLTSFEPICLLVRSPTLIVVNSKSPYRTLADLVSAARAKPGELTLASAGPATPLHIGFEMFKRAANVNMTYVPFRGNAPAMNALLGGHVTSMLANHAEAAENLNSGTLRALATGSRTRIESLPNVPTIAESGFKNFEVDVWFGVVAPARTPADTMSQLSRWFTAALQAPDAKSKLLAQGLHPVGSCGGDFAAHLRKQYEDYGRVIRDANIKGE